jgi:hypothetical protein
MNVLPKHQRYKTPYRRFDLYWGLGVEHETYLLTSQTRTITTFDGKMKPERYSVNYYAVYQPDTLKEALADVIQKSGGSLTVPVLMNGHSWTHCDISGEHKTTYEKVPQLNPRFRGETFFEWACQNSPWIRENYDQTFVWDGDTIEFITQNFYNATVESVYQELLRIEKEFLRAVQSLPAEGLLADYGPLRIAAPRNEPWAVHLTNPRNISMFNNGTLHLNVTLPTRLGWNRRPLFWREFVEKHRILARCIQWMEPLWVAIYGSGDPFALHAPHFAEKFAAGSQRLAVSRYIGLGTFDTDKMPTGKILQVNRTEAGPFPWYDRLYDRTAYKTLDVIGLDLNFNKHWAHGLEIRLFDQMPFSRLRQILDQVVLLMDVALAIHSESRPMPDPRKDLHWQKMATESLYEGSTWKVEPEQIHALARAFGIVCDKKEPLYVEEVLQWLQDSLAFRRGWCWNHIAQKSAGLSTNCLVPW